MPGYSEQRLERVGGACSSTLAVSPMSSFDCAIIYRNYLGSRDATRVTENHMKAEIENGGPCPTFKIQDLAYVVNLVVVMIVKAKPYANTRRVRLLDSKSFTTSP